MFTKSKWHQGHVRRNDKSLNQKVKILHLSGGEFVKILWIKRNLTRKLVPYCSRRGDYCPRSHASTCVLAGVDTVFDRMQALVFSPGWILSSIACRHLRSRRGEYCPRSHTGTCVLAGVNTALDRLQAIFIDFCLHPEHSKFITGDAGLYGITDIELCVKQPSQLNFCWKHVYRSYDLVTCYRSYDSGNMLQVIRQW